MRTTSSSATPSQTQARRGPRAEDSSEGSYGANSTRRAARRDLYHGQDLVRRVVHHRRREGRTGVVAEQAAHRLPRLGAAPLGPTAHERGVLRSCPGRRSVWVHRTASTRAMMRGSVDHVDYAHADAHRRGRSCSARRVRASFVRSASPTFETPTSGGSARGRAPSRLRPSRTSSLRTIPATCTTARATTTSSSWAKRAPPSSATARSRRGRRRSRRLRIRTSQRSPRASGAPPRRPAPRRRRAAGPRIRSHWPSTCQVVLRWAVQQGEHMAVLTKSQKEEHLAEAAAIEVRGVRSHRQRRSSRGIIRKSDGRTLPFRTRTSSVSRASRGLLPRRLTGRRRGSRMCSVCRR